MLKIPANLAIEAGVVLLGCALGGCASKPTPMTSRTLPPTIEAIGRPALASAQATSVPSHETVFAKLADDACGLSGGCLVGASHSMLEGHRLELACKANERSEQHPAVPADAREAHSADLNDDGFVTLDELIAMRRAGLDDQIMIDRLRATGHVFILSPRQWQYLYERGVNQPVLDWMGNQGAVAAR